MRRAERWFNTATNVLWDAWRDSSGFERKIYALVVAALLVFTFGRCAWEMSVAQGVRSSQLAAQLKDATQRESVAVAWGKAQRGLIVHDTLRITRAIHATDTLYATLPETVVTAADTVRVVTAFPMLRAGYDSLKASCSDLQRSALVFVSACDSIQSALRDQVRIVTEQLRTERPRWYAKPLRYLELGAVGYVGYKVGRGR